MSPHLLYARIGAAVILANRPPSAADVMAIADAGRLAVIEAILDGTYGQVSTEGLARAQRQASNLRLALSGYTTKEDM